jgi:hypothetical protein
VAAIELTMVDALVVLVAATRSSSRTRGLQFVTNTSIGFEHSDNVGGTNQSVEANRDDVEHQDEQQVKKRDARKRTIR